MIERLLSCSDFVCRQSYRKYALRESVCFICKEIKERKNISLIFSMKFYTLYHSPFPSFRLTFRDTDWYWLEVDLIRLRRIRSVHRNSLVCASLNRISYTVRIDALRIIVSVHCRVISIDVASNDNNLLLVIRVERPTPRSLSLCRIEKRRVMILTQFGNGSVWFIARATLAEKDVGENCMKLSRCCQIDHIDRSN